MPTAPPTRCLTPGCPGYAYRRGVCADHYTPWEQPSLHTLRVDPRRWQPLRRRHLRAYPRCNRCGAPGTDVDHIRPIADGGAIYDPANLQTLCSGCHDTKTRAENAARNRRRAQKRR